ncbi:MAG: integrin alpha [Candidatus Midichloria sp.]|nr:integrin alpha [Candidatus Midichloria sp.]
MAKMVLPLMAFIKVIRQEFLLHQGDINGDGKDDLIIGALYANDDAAGQAYVVYGRANFASPLSLSSLNGTNGFIINGIKLGG